MIANPGSLAARWIVLRGHVSSLIGFGMLTVAALRMAIGGQDERDWFAAATIVLLFSAITVSWDFLIAIARTEARDRK
jgi:hypothetical protein